MLGIKPVGPNAIKAIKSDNIFAIWIHIFCKGKP